MFTPIICKTCTNEIGQECLIYRYCLKTYIEKKIGKTEVSILYTGGGTYGNLLDELGIFSECCRRTILSYRTLSDLTPM